MGHGRGVALNLVPHTQPLDLSYVASAGVDRLKIDRAKTISTDHFSAPAALVLTPKHVAPAWNYTRLVSYLTQVAARYHLKLQLTTIPVFSAR
jgi:hypothetical protein